MKRKTCLGPKGPTDIYDFFFKKKGWIKNAICGLLGNIEVETIYTEINVYHDDDGYRDT